MPAQQGVDRQAIHAEMEQARVVFHQLVGHATAVDLRRASDGTRWNNEQLLFHMLFGYMVVRRLVFVVRLFGRLPAGVSRVFAKLLDFGTALFDVVNYYGSCGGARVFANGRMVAEFDRVVASLHRRLDADSEKDLQLGMHCPVRWDPFFEDFMTLAQMYHFATQHFEFHQNQLTLGQQSPR